MARPVLLPAADVDAWLAAHPGWARSENGKGLVRGYRFADFSQALAFVVRVGMASERRDHHPDVELGWGRARILWSTHDAGGVTDLDLELAVQTDTLAGA